MKIDYFHHSLYELDLSRLTNIIGQNPINSEGLKLLCKKKWKFVYKFWLSNNYS